MMWKQLICFFLQFFAQTVNGFLVDDLINDTNYDITRTPVKKFDDILNVTIYIDLIDLVQLISILFSSSRFFVKFFIFLR